MKLLKNILGLGLVLLTSAKTQASFYGDPNNINTACTWIDVTSKVKLNTTVGNAAFGDPCYGQVKKLIIIPSGSNTVYSTQTPGGYAEGTVLSRFAVLQGSNLDLNSNTSFKAFYGAPAAKVLDVTNATSNINPSQTISNSTFGNFDPAPGVKKILKYANGQIIPEGQTLNYTINACQNSDPFNQTQVNGTWTPNGCQCPTKSYLDYASAICVIGTTSKG